MGPSDGRAVGAGVRAYGPGQVKQPGQGDKTRVVRQNDEGVIALPTPLLLVVVLARLGSAASAAGSAALGSGDQSECAACRGEPSHRIPHACQHVLPDCARPSLPAPRPRTFSLVPWCGGIPFPWCSIPPLLAPKAPVRPFPNRPVHSPPASQFISITGRGRSTSSTRAHHRRVRWCRCAGRRER